MKTNMKISDEKVCTNDLSFWIMLSKRKSFTGTVDVTCFVEGNGMGWCQMPLPNLCFGHDEAFYFVIRS